MAINVDAGVATIGVELDTSSATAEMGRMESKFDSSVDKMTRTARQKFGDTFKFIENGISLLTRGIEKAFLFMVHQLTSALKSLESELTKIQGFLSSMSMVAGPEQSAEQYQFLKKIANELGVSLSSLTENYGRLSAAMVSSGAPLSSVQALFEGLARASRAYHLSAQDTHWAMYAFTQIASKAKLSMEELNRQFGEKVPGALTIFAESLRGPLEKELGKTGASIQELKSKLLELVKAGKIDPIQFSIAVGPDLIEQYQAASDIAAKSVDSAINRLKNTWTDFAYTVVNSGAAEKIAQMFDTITDKIDDSTILNAFADLLGDTADLFTEKIKSITAEDIKTGFNTLKDALKGITEFMAQLITLMGQALPHLREIAVLAGAISGAKLGASIGASMGGPAGAGIGAVAGAVAGGGATSLVMYPEARNAVFEANQPFSDKNLWSSGLGLPDQSASKSSRLSTGKIGGLTAPEPVLATFDESVYGGRSKLPAYRYQAMIDRQKALDNLFLQGSGGKDKQAKVDPLKTFMDNLDYKMEGKEEGLSPETLKSLDQLEKAFKKGLVAKRSYAEYKAFIEENDPATIKRLNEQTAALKSSAEAAEKEVLTMQDQVKYYGMTEMAKQELIATEKEEALVRAYNNLSMDESNALAKMQIEYLTREIDARKKLKDLSGKNAANQMREKYKTPQEQYEDRRKAIDELREGKFITIEEWHKFSQAEYDAWQKTEDKAKGVTDQMSEFAKQAAKNMQDSMADFFFDVMQGKFDELGTRFKQMLDRMVANAIAADLANRIFGNMGTTGKLDPGSWIGQAIDWGVKAWGGSSGSGGTPGFDAALYSSELNQLAKGGAFGGSGLGQYVNTVQTRPTPFTFTNLKPFAHGGIFAEKNAEAVMPLVRTAGGELGVKAVNSDKTQANIVINIGSTSGDKAEIRRSAAAGAQAALAAFNGAKRYG